MENMDSILKSLYLLRNAPFFLQRKYFLVQILHWKIANIGWICQISKKALLMHFDIRKKKTWNKCFYHISLQGPFINYVDKRDGQLKGDIVFIEYYYKGDISRMGQIASQQNYIFDKIYHSLWKVPYSKICCGCFLKHFLMNSTTLKVWIHLLERLTRQEYYSIKQKIK